MINGFPTQDARLQSLMNAEGHGNAFFQHLAGNSFPATVIAAFVIALVRGAAVLNRFCVLFFGELQGWSPSWESEALAGTQAGFPKMPARVANSA